MTSTHFSYERALRDLALTLCFLVIAFIFMNFFIETHVDIFVPKHKEIKILEEKSLALNHLFPLEKVQIALLPVDFSNELYILTSLQRPDSIDEKRLFLAHKKGWMNEEVFLNRWVYLREEPQGYFISEKITPLAFRVVEKKSKLFIEQDLRFDDVDQEKFLVGAISGFYPEVKPVEEKNPPPLFVKLFQSPYIGKDLIKKDDCYQIEIDGQPIFLKKHDLFVFQENRWQKVVDQVTKGYPIFRIEEVSDSTIFIAGWDVDGKYFCKNLVVQKSKDPLKKANTWISQIKKRTKSKVSMSLLGKRMILKKGDWLIEKNKKWIALRTDSQKENFLKQKAECEVFVFEDIVENKGDKKFIGLLYNSTRTKAIKMEIPFGNKTTTTSVPKTPIQQQQSRYTPLKRRGLE